MASNPTVIPGVYGWGDDLAQAFQSIGQGLAAMFYDPRLDQALKLFQDPAHMQGVATRLEQAHAQQEFTPPIDIGALFKGDLRGPVPDAIEAEMLAAGLDPKNESHMRAALPILRASRLALSPQQRAQARLSQAQSYVQSLADLDREAVETTGEQLREQRATSRFNAEVYRLRLSQGVPAAQIQNELSRLNDDTYRTELRTRFYDTAEQLAEQNPRLGALLAGSFEGFQQGLLQLMEIEARLKAGGTGVDMKDLSAVLSWRREELNMARNAVFEAESIEQARAALDNYNSMVADTKWLFETYGLPGQFSPTPMQVEETSGFLGLGRGFRVVPMSTSPIAPGPRSSQDQTADREAFKTSFNSLLSEGRSPEQIDKDLIAALESGQLGFLDLYSIGQVQDFRNWLYAEGFVVPDFIEALNGVIAEMKKKAREEFEATLPKDVREQNRARLQAEFQR